MLHTLKHLIILKKVKIRIKKGLLSGTIIAPPSKSMSHRYLIASSLSFGNVVKNISYSDDIIATLSCLKNLGSKYVINQDTVTFNSFNPINNKPEFDANESGSTLRFLIPLSLVYYDEVVFKGTKKLIERGIKEYERELPKKGIEVTTLEDRIILKGKLKPGNYLINGNTSSQYISGLLFALPLLNESSIIEVREPFESSSYVELTLEVLKSFGIKIERVNNKFLIEGNQKYSSNNINIIEGDYSNISPFMAFSHLSSNLKIEGLNDNSSQGDKRVIEYLDLLDNGYSIIDLSNNIDLAPILMVYASLKHGAKFIHTKRLKDKESDRGEAIRKELSKLGVSVKIEEDSIEVLNDMKIKDNIVFDSHNDHRIVMALSLLSSKMDIVIENYNAINKSFPSYFDELKRLGKEVYEE